MKRLLVTGAAGNIGQVILPFLTPNYRLRGFDRIPAPGYSESMKGDICDFNALSTAMQDVDAVLHLAYAATEDFNAWETVLNDGLDDTYKVFNGAVDHGIRKIVFASTIKINNYDLRHHSHFTYNVPPRPMDLYAGGKLMAESLAQTFTSLNTGLDIICLRIGFLRNLPLITNHRSDDDHLGWCHPEDLAQLIDRSIQSTGLGFQVFYAISRAGCRRWDLDTARRRVGYRPTHNAHDHFVSDGLEELPFTRNQRTILRAALLGDSPAGKEAWKRWSATLDRRLQIPEHQAVYELIPLAIEAAGNDRDDLPAEEGLLLERMSGAMKQSWYQTQLQLEAARNLALQLHDHFIQSIFLDDLAAWRMLYPSVMIRKVNHLSLLVDPDQQAQTSELLVSLGWQPALDNPSPYVREFEQGLYHLTLRKNLAPFFDLPWNIVQDHNMQVDNLTFPDHHLLFLICCWQAVQGWKAAALLGTADAHKLLCLIGTQLSPQILLDLARAGKVQAGLFYGLHQLIRLSDNAAAVRLNHQLRALPLTRRERLLAWLIASGQAQHAPQSLRRTLHFTGVGLP
jgi:uronate dehydrogenase